MVNRLVINKMGMAIDESLVKGFQTTLHGTLIRHGDNTYENARKVWNGMVDKYPSAIVYCVDIDDVIKAVNFARNNNLLVAVRSGGHNVAGNSVCDDGIVVDLSLMKKIEIDAASCTALAQTGLTLGEFDRETQGFGLATPLGIVSRTGMAGLTLGGGIGWLMRKHGLTCDNLLSVDVITADGRLVTANDNENPDLFWGVRGGGGNFGVVTKFKFQLHPVEQVIGGMVLYQASKAKEVFRFYRNYIATIPDEMTTMLAFLTAPTPFLPERIHGDPLIAIHVCYTGTIESGKSILEPIRAFDRPVADMIKVMSYVDVQCMLDSGASSGLQNYWKSSYLRTFDDKVMEIIIEYFNNTPSHMTQIHIQHMQGAVCRRGENETAFSHRNALCVLNIVSKWNDPSDSVENINWTRELSDSLKPFSSGVYVNFLGDEGEDAVKAAYNPLNFRRLVALKNKYDPANLFSLNQNIKPTA
jgi:FAD/FMN-containing dehydrogenase